MDGVAGNAVHRMVRRQHRKAERGGGVVARNRAVHLPHCSMLSVVRGPVLHREPMEQWPVELATATKIMVVAPGRAPAH